MERQPWAGTTAGGVTRRFSAHTCPEQSRVLFPSSYKCKTIYFQGEIKKRHHKENNEVAVAASRFPGVRGPNPCVEAQPLGVVFAGGALGQ